MNRRGFLQTLAGAAATTLVAPRIVKAESGEALQTDLALQTRLEPLKEMPLACEWAGDDCYVPDDLDIPQIDYSPISVVLQAPAGQRCRTLIHPTSNLDENDSCCIVGVRSYNELGQVKIFQIGPQVFLHDVSIYNTFDLFCPIDSVLISNENPLAIEYQAMHDKDEWLLLTLWVKNATKPPPA